jgi:spore coat polysaccharide biosynthesis protein SpsF
MAAPGGASFRTTLQGGLQMKTLVVIQARTGSTRLPNKVLLPLAGSPLLQRMIQRVRAATCSFELVVATTTAPEDDAIRQLCREIDVECFSGHPTDLLDRHYRAAMAAKADVVVKIPSDCPLIDPAVIDRVLTDAEANRERYDYVSNLHPPTWPDGHDVEVIRMAAVETAWREAERDFEREHTTPFIWDNPERFRIGNVEWKTGLDYSMTHRWTIDYIEDYLFIESVYDELWSAARPMFSIQDVLNLLAARPGIAAINARYRGVNWYRHHLGELRTKTAEDTRSIEPAATLTAR